ncbi:hypothetical protein HanRHA438_Chr14g0667221 [Helianthus annuus]|uniref:Uncharacterized protein n=1 Tax=Helianthus annuus TaxID=4232 RepID=A0A9K3EAY7_HELAN|nr:hypothetical protein HanXRQr2_Chr14g0656261 [Helianthus annuus]KAJ0465104.1 hypothetical protein HanHA300_Chr14g0534661 [Helianthus annuus]KAJ0469814.1 hypothetical protein HanIR_Chr14g0712001 [Helianthus annuus]KAJ0486696.1 hypothetical protein HanHA89_Chr14g0582461 [Helianthus annuus]KAJ0660827.1 hypothetical protein HanOQP8_Chr14g0542011 [Helianthus annuus]
MDKDVMADATMVVIAPLLVDRVSTTVILDLFCPTFTLHCTSATLSFISPPLWIIEVTVGFDSRACNPRYM